ncbi:MAG TPA: hypothetical protein VMS56_14040 [Thermoanaerobaculia bacterium]|nr:hypothetical protein [Thermoanaerobaculia bacterium]
MSEMPLIIRTERLSPEQRALVHRRDGMVLSRKRVVHDLETSRSALYRRNLEAGLLYLDEQIAELDRSLIALAKPPPAGPKPGRSGSRLRVKEKARQG